MRHDDWLHFFVFHCLGRLRFQPHSPLFCLKQGVLHFGCVPCARCLPVIRLPLPAVSVCLLMGCEFRSPGKALLVFFPTVWWLLFPLRLISCPWGGRFRSCRPAPLGPGVSFMVVLAWTSLNPESYRMTVCQVQHFWLCPAVCYEKEPSFLPHWLISVSTWVLVFFNGLEFTMSVWCRDHSDLGSGSPFSQFLCLCDLVPAPPQAPVSAVSAQTVSPLSGTASWTEMWGWWAPGRGMSPLLGLPGRGRRHICSFLPFSVPIWDYVMC